MTQAIAYEQTRPAAGARERAARARWRGLPLALGLIYLIGTYLAFLLWPVDWPITQRSEWVRLSAYVGLCFGLLAAGFLIGVRGRPRHGRLPHRRLLYFAGAALSVLLLEPLTEVETGRSLLELPSALADQTQAYALFQLQTNLGAASNPLISLLSVLAAPLSFAVPVLMVLHWRSMSWAARAMGLISAVSGLALSIMRGTDREVANLFIVLGSTAMVLLVRSGRGGRVQLWRILKRYGVPVLLVIVAVWAGAVVTTGRKEGRLGGVATACLGETGICADLNAPALSWMTERQRFGASIFAMSVSQGYYGLDLAMNEDFRSTFGFGHSPAVMSLYQRLTGREGLQTDAYTYRLSNQGWSDQNFWSTMMVWVANDVGFTGAAVFVGLMGLLWGRTWRDATMGRDDKAAILFSLSMMFVAYVPANNQVFLSLDSYCAFVVWLIAWLFVGRRAPLRSVEGRPR